MDRQGRRAWRTSATSRCSSPRRSSRAPAPTGATRCPIFEKILALDPDHLSATLGLVELYVEAGLKRTALATLERAVARQPQSVALLRIYAGQLRALGRDTEAAEVEARYAGLRFDDSALPQPGQVELAVARRDKAGAERWLDRFLKSEPDSACARGVAARTYRALGQRQRAVAAYQRALALAPEDIPALRALSDLYGEEDRRDDQLKLLRQILALSPAGQGRARVRRAHRAAQAARRRGSTRGRPSASSPCAARPPSATPSARCAASRSPPSSPTAWRAASVRWSSSPSPTRRRPAPASTRSTTRPTSRRVQLRAAKVYRADGKVDEAIESGESGANNPALATYTSSRTVLRPLPPARARATWSSSATASRTCRPATRSPTTTARSSTWAPTSPSPAASTCSSPRKPHLPLQRRQRPRRPARDHHGLRRRRPARRPLPRRARAGAGARAGDAALGGDRAARPRLHLQGLGRGRRLVLGPGARPVRRRRRGAPPGQGDHQGPQGRRRQGAGHLQVRDPPPLRGAGAGHRGHQAAPLRADDRARLGRLQGQGDGHRHHAPRGGHPLHHRPRAHRHARRHRGRRRRAWRPSITPSPTCPRSISTSTAPPSTPAWASSP